MTKLLILILVFYFGAGLFLFITQRNFIYFPTPESNHPYNETVFDFNDVKIRSVVLNKAKSNVIIYFGGNAEAVEYNAPGFEKSFPDHTVYLVKYRGYGGSTGKPSEDKIYEDALRIFDELKKQNTNISLIGRSLGSGVASYVAANRKVDNLVLVTPFDSVQSIAQKTYPIFPMPLLLKDKYDTAGRAGSITANTLLLIAENDRVIKKSHSDNLFNAFVKKTPQRITISNTGHNSISQSPRYYELLRKFITAE